jgi:hypothetical protein
LAHGDAEVACYLREGDGAIIILQNHPNTVLGLEFLLIYNVRL